MLYANSGNWRVKKEIPAKFIVTVLLALNLLKDAGCAWAQAASTTKPALQLTVMLGPLTANPNPFSSTLSISARSTQRARLADGSLADSI